jgi:hypothetical protein
VTNGQGELEWVCCENCEQAFITAKPAPTALPLPSLAPAPQTPSPAVVETEDTSQAVTSEPGPAPTAPATRRAPSARGSSRSTEPPTGGAQKGTQARPSLASSPPASPRGLRSPSSSLDDDPQDAFDRSSQWCSASPPLPPSAARDLRGYIMKRGSGSIFFGGSKAMRRRYLVLSGGRLSYYKTDTDFGLGVAPQKGKVGTHACVNSGALGALKRQEP